MTDIQIARDFLQFNLPEQIKNRLDLNTLGLVPQEYVTSALRRKIADVVYAVRMLVEADKLAYISLVLEHQSVTCRCGC